MSDVHPSRESGQDPQDPWSTPGTSQPAEPSMAPPPAPPGAYPLPPTPGAYPPPPQGGWNPPPPPQGGWAPPPPQGGWAPPPPPPSHGAYPPPPGGFQPPDGIYAPPSPPGPSRWRTPVRLAVVAAVAAGAMGLGIVTGHLAWGTGSPASSQASGSNGSSNPGSFFNPFGSGGSNSGGSNSGGSNSGDNPFGSNPFGSNGNGSNGSGSNGSGSSGNSSSGAGGPSDTSSIAAKVTPDLVNVNVKFAYQQTSGAGTGIVLTSNGEVLTNNHVINGATSISVTDLGNGKTYTASVVGYDPTHDLAVIQLQGASGLKTATLADSSKVTQGEPVVAVGNAGGTGTPTPAGGSITGLNQAITAGDELNGTSENLSGLIETNADIQAGDSGGALVNTQGQVIGMNTAASQGYSLSASGNQGYAIPINQAVSTAEQIEAGQGSSTVHVGATAFLGILFSSNGGQNGSFGNQTTQGISVTGAVAGSPAAKAGLGQGDTVTTIDGQTITDYTTIRDVLIQKHPGDTVQIGWTDSSGQSHVSNIVLGSGPAS